MTLQDLKNNRDQVLAEIAKYAPVEKTKCAMEILAMSVEDTFETTIEGFVYEQLYPLFSVKTKFGTAEMIAEINNHRTFNHLTKQYN